MNLAQRLKQENKNRRTMLSILIPTYDYTCYKLVLDLHEQAERLGIDYEIIVAEDGSHYPVSIIANHKITDLTHCRHLIRKENVGRAAIRNVLIDEAKGDMLMFMDSDGKVVSDDFLSKYVEAGKEHDVVCGGIKTPDVWYNPESMLRWKYEKDYECKYGCISEQFRSFCFLISRKAAEAVRFDERYKMYGYEDVQYGKDLKAAGFTVFCIDNPLMNMDIEDNKTFLRKTEEALQSAKAFEAEIGDSVRVVQVMKKYRWCAGAMRLAFKLCAGAMRRNLLSANPSLTMFSLYKLGYYANLK